MIELYRPELADEFMRLGKMMHRESSYRDSAFNEKKVAAIPLTPGVFCAMSVREGIYTGFFVGKIGAYYFSDECAAHDVAFYVDAEYRNGKSGIELIFAYEEWAKKQGVKSIYLSQSSGVQIDRGDRLFDGLGYTRLGSNVKKGV